MYELTVPQDVSVEGLGFAIAGQPLDRLSFAVFYREWLVSLIPHTNAAQTGVLVELAAKLGEVTAGSKLELTDAAHEALARAVSGVQVNGAFALRVATFMHAVMVAKMDIAVPAPS